MCKISFNKPEIWAPCPLLSSDQKDADTKLMKCLECIEQEKEMLQKDVDQLDEILSKAFSQDVVVSSL